MENNTQENWWSKGEEDQPESQGIADEFSHESSVIVYNKSPLAASLPWLGILAFSTLLIQAQAPASGGGFFVANCFNLFFAIVLLLVLISNENLGGRISVDTGKSRIWVGHRGFRTELKYKPSIKYKSYDHIQLDKRQEVTHGRDSDGDPTTGVATYYDIQLSRAYGSHKTIFSINGLVLSKWRAGRIGKSIARVAGLDYRKK
tara:strand:+ start:62 stop:670 length:609 start_codon:yes stop_codon:yes gene_type:complete